MQFSSMTENFIKICEGVVPHYLFPSYRIIQQDEICIYDFSFTSMQFDFWLAGKSH